ncbi:MAG: GIY-YIG nuclease family protein [Salinivirgaceae bacterium]|nr:GIY-YIG nuclease family protein [Salinivirgaceae bacterium]
MINASGIYQIRNTVNGKRYVGSSVNMRARWRTHRTMLKHRKHHAQKLQNAWNKYGCKAFVFEVLLICAKEDLVFFEQRALDTLHAVRGGYNTSLGAEAYRRERNSKEHNARISASHIGKACPEEVKAQISRKVLAENRGETHTYKGETKTIRQWAEEYGLTYNVLQHRIRIFGSLKKALEHKTHSKSECAGIAREKLRLRVRKFKHNGQEKSVADLAKEYGISRAVLSKRIYKGNRTVEEAVTYKAPRLEFDGKSLSVAEWAAELSLTPNTIRGRLARGWTVEETLSISMQKQGSNGRAAHRKSIKNGEA